ncbi:MAG: lamin tail domain-containing protein, partial [Planctomycetota bacterium]
DPCSGTLYLVGPDDLGNCVVDRISWDCRTDLGGEVTNDRAYGKFCGAVGSDSRINPSPGEPNELESLFFGASHTDAGSDDPNPCVEAFSFPGLEAVFFLDEALVDVLEEDVITEITFDVEGATKLGDPLIAILGAGFDAPVGFTAVRVTQSLFLDSPGVSRVDYSVSIVDACGNTISPCAPGQRCFSLGIGSEGLPGVVINEANRNSVLPGSGGVARPWLELFNGSAESIDLGGMFLSAQARAPRDVPLPQGTILAAGESLVVLTDGGPALQGVGVPAHLVVELDWITRKLFCFNPNEPCDDPGSANLIRSVCGIDPDSPEDTPDPVRIYLTDHLERGSCLVDVFGFEFPNPDCSDGTSMGRFPDGAEEIVELAEPSPGAGAAPVNFIRGDADADGDVDNSDLQLILELANGQGVPPPCMDRFDVDDNGQVNITDGINLSMFINFDGPPPPPPFPEEGEDPTPDSLSCTR